MSKQQNCVSHDVQKALDLVECQLKKVKQALGKNSMSISSTLMLPPPNWCACTFTCDVT